MAGAPSTILLKILLLHKCKACLQMVGDIWLTNKQLLYKFDTKKLI